MPSRPCRRPSPLSIWRSRRCIASSAIGALAAATSNSRPLSAAGSNGRGARSLARVCLAGPAHCRVYQPPPVAARQDRPATQTAGRHPSESITTLCGVSQRRFAPLTMIVALAVAAIGAAPRPALAGRAPFKCPRGGLAGNACLAPGAPCAARSRSLYAQRGLLCTRARLRRGGLALQREGGAFAVDTNGHVGLAEAEQAFIAIYGPLPGIKRIPGAVALPPGADVTGPRLWIRHYLARLTAPQRRAVERVLAPARARSRSQEEERAAERTGADPDRADRTGNRYHVSLQTDHLRGQRGRARQVEQGRAQRRLRRSADRR